MAVSRLLIASFLVCLLLVQLVAADQVKSSGPENASLRRIDCGGHCTRRCRLSRRPRLCHRACSTCCYRCNCVPPGTYGNYHTCPCYDKLTTHGGRHKCP